MSDGAPEEIDYRRVVDAIPRAIIVSDIAGTILIWNHEAELLYGWSVEEAVGRSVLDLLAPANNVPQYRALLDDVASGMARGGDRVVMRKDGRPIRVSSVAKRVESSATQSDIIVGLSFDVTDLRVAEQRAREQTEHFRLALEAGGLGTWRWDIATGETVWDERLEVIFGLEPGEFNGSFDGYVALLHPDDCAAVLSAVQRAVETKSAYRLEHRIVHPDGKVRWINGGGDVVLDERGVVTGTIGCVTDITERLRQDLELLRLAELAEASAISEREHRERLEFTSKINDVLNNAETVDEIMANVTRAAVPRLGDWCAIHLLPSGSSQIPTVEIAHVDPSMVAYARQLQARFPYDPDGEVGVAHVIRTGISEFYPEIDESVLDQLNATDDERAVVDQLALRSSITVAITKRGRTFGAMQFVMSKSSRRYSERDVALAETIAGRIAASLENRRLNEQQRVIAHTLQRSLLPPSLPKIDGVDIAVRYSAAGEGTEAGGDFYDLFAIDDHTWAVVIGDVCGTGPAAASLTGLARHSIRESAWHADTPTQILQSLNRSILRSETKSFCTCIFATLTRDEIETTLTVT